MKTAGPIQQHKPSASAPPEKLLSPLVFGIVAAALAAGVFAVYSPALNFQFVLDDHHFVSDPRLQSSGHLWEYFTSFVWSQVPGGPVSFYRPFFLLWLRLNFILSGASPWGWHFLSITKHIVASVLLAMLVWKLLRDRVAALFAATLFALHPAQTESVAWSTVPDPLMAAAIFSALLLYFRYADGSASVPASLNKAEKKARKRERGKSKQGSSIWWLVASASACVAALMAKETGIVLPVMFFALVFLLPVDGPGRTKEEDVLSSSFGVQFISAVRKSLPFFGVTLFYLLLRLNALAGKLSSQTQHLPWTTVVLSWPATLWFYVKVMLWPARSRAFANPDIVEGFSFHEVVLPGLGVGLAMAVVLGVCVLVLKKARLALSISQVENVKRVLLLGVLFLVLPLLLALNLNALNPGDFLHGRYTYLPLAGTALLLSAGWHTAPKSGRAVLLAATGALAIAFGVLTVMQEGEWKDDLTLFTQAHQDAPLNAPVTRDLMRARTNVALIQADEGKCDEAMPVFEEAIQKYPEDWYAWAGRGECLFKKNDLAKAEESLRHASELANQPYVTEMWQQVRKSLGLSTTSP